MVCDNYRLGVLERLGIDYEKLRVINPRIISASITAYGSKGPLAADPGFDPLLQAQSGLMSAQGGEDEPVFHQIAVNDCASAMVTAFAIAAALHAREKSGRGQQVETALANQSVLCQSGELVRFAGRPESPRGGRDCLGLGALHRFYACSDGWVGLACSEPVQLSQLCGALELDDLARSWRWERVLAEPWDGALAQTLSEAFGRRKCEELLETLRGRGVPAAPVTQAVDTFESPLYLANDFFCELDHPKLGRLWSARGFADFSRTPGGFARAAPLLGEHNAEVLAELGFDGERIGQLARDGVLGSE